MQTCSLSLRSSCLDEFPRLLAYVVGTRDSGANEDGIGARIDHAADVLGCFHAAFRDCDTVLGDVRKELFRVRQVDLKTFQVAAVDADHACVGLERILNFVAGMCLDERFESHGACLFHECAEVLDKRRDYEESVGTNLTHLWVVHDEVLTQNRHLYRFAHLA